jgi:uncharacterized membrane protein YjjP (DUF1212 family)
MSHESHSQLAIHRIENVEGQELLQRQQVARRTRIAAIIFLVLLALGAGRTVVSRIANSRALEEGVRDRSAVYVKTAPVTSADTGQKLELPATL